MLTSINVALKDAADGLIYSIPGLKRVALAIARSIHNLVVAADGIIRSTADVLHGTWLGHPLHPVLTDVTIGAWSFAAVFDILSMNRDNEAFNQAADNLVAIGVLSAIPTALAGIDDYSAIKQDAAEYGLVHGTLNTLGLITYLASWRARHNDERGQGISLALLGMGILTVSAWLGGELVYRLRVGVNHNQEPTQPDYWMPIMPENELHESDHRRIDVEGNAVLLYRYGGTVYAIGAVCSHAGGPLEEGTFEGFCVTCPLHDSVYDMRDGTIVYGPTTYNQPRYRTRIRNGQIELIADSAYSSQQAEMQPEEQSIVIS